MCLHRPKSLNSLNWFLPFFLLQVLVVLGSTAVLLDLPSLAISHSNSNLCWSNSSLCLWRSNMRSSFLFISEFCSFQSAVHLPNADSISETTGCLPAVNVKKKLLCFKSFTISILFICTVEKNIKYITVEA